MADGDSGGPSSLGVGTAVLLVAGVLYNYGFMSGLAGNLYQPKLIGFVNYVDFLESIVYVLPTILVMTLVAGVVAEMVVQRSKPADGGSRPNSEAAYPRRR